MYYLGMQYDSLNWQHPFCGKSRQNPEIIILFVDYICRNPSDRHFQLAASNQLIGSPPKTEGSFLTVVHGVQIRIRLIVNYSFSANKFSSAL